LAPVEGSETAAAEEAPAAARANGGAVPSSLAEAEASETADAAEGAAHCSSSQTEASKTADAAALQPPLCRTKYDDFLPDKFQEGPYKGQKRARLVLSLSDPAAQAQHEAGDGAKPHHDQEIQAIDRVMESALNQKCIDEVST